MKQYIYILKLHQEYRDDAKWTQETFEIVSSHFNYLSKLKEDKIVVLVGKTDYKNDHENNFGLVIFEAKTLEEANNIMNNDPAILHNVMYGKIHPFGIALQ